MQDATQQTFTLEEMADALGISPEFCSTGCDTRRSGFIDPAMLSYACIDGLSLTFSREMYDYNIRKRSLYLELAQIGDWKNPEACNVWLSDFVLKNRDPQIDAGSRKSLQDFVSAWERMDFRYSDRILVFRRYISDLRDIWVASRYLAGIPHVTSRADVTLIGDQYGATGKRIPFQWLRYDPARGLFDRRESADNGEFIPKNIYFLVADGVELHVGDFIRVGGTDELVDVIGMIVAIDDDDVAYAPSGQKLCYTDRCWITGYSRRP